MRDEAERVLMEVSGIEDLKLLRAKIRSIRGTYNNEIRKIKKATTGSGTEDTSYKPKLHWFSFADSFLSKNAEDESGSETNLFQDDDSEQIKKRSADATEVEPLGTPILSSSLTTAATSVKIRSTSTGNSTSLSETDISPSCKSGRLKHSRNFANVNPKRHKFETETKSTVNSSVGDAIREEVVTLMHDTNNVTNDEFMVFGQSVGIQLSKLPLHTALQLQFYIQSLLTNARLREVSDTTFPFTPPTNLISNIHSASSSYPIPDPTSFQPETIIPS